VRPDDFGGMGAVTTGPAGWSSAPCFPSVSLCSRSSKARSSEARSSEAGDATSSHQSLRYRHWGKAEQPRKGLPSRLRRRRTSAAPHCGHCPKLAPLRTTPGRGESSTLFRDIPAAARPARAAPTAAAWPRRNKGRRKALKGPSYSAWTQWWTPR
jgi:hypothetical protein